MRAGDLAPDHSNLGSANFLLSLVDVRNLLAEVEAVQSSDTAVQDDIVGGDLLGSIGVINTLDLDQAGLGVGGAAATLVGEVATPEFNLRQSRFLCSHLCPNLRASSRYRPELSRRILVVMASSFSFAVAPRLRTSHRDKPHIGFHRTSKHRRSNTTYLT